MGFTDCLVLAQEIYLAAVSYFQFCWERELGSTVWISNAQATPNKSPGLSLHIYANLK